MKKLVIASAVAAIMASGTAMADTTFGGNARLQLKNQDELDLDSTKLTIDIKSSEDLGNGMTAIARIELEHDDADEKQSGWDNDLSYVGLKGGFGQVTLGVQDDAAGLAGCGMDDQYIYNTGKACGAGAFNGPLDNAVVYANTLGAMTLVLGATFDGSKTGGNPAAGDHTVVALGYGGDGFNLGVQVTSPDGDLNLEDQMIIGGDIALGDVTLGLIIADGTGFGAGDTETSTGINVKMPLGGGTFKAGISDTDDLNGSTYTNLQYEDKLGKTAYWGVQYSAEDNDVTDPDDILALFLGKKF